MNEEKLHTLLHTKLDKGLREFHRHMFKIVLPTVIQNMFFNVNLRKKNKNRMENKQNDFKHFQSKMAGCQNDVDKMIKLVPKV